MNAQPTADLTLDGYQLICFIGRGGFGEVWLCRSGATGSYHALKFISGGDPDLIEKEHHSLTLYRNASSRLRSPHLVPIEHINRHDAGLYYVMPLADGITDAAPMDPNWQPLSLSSVIEARAATPTWFSSKEIAGLIQPILDALQTLSDAGLVHRDVKPDNILFFNGAPCLGDISLLGNDAVTVTRRGTPGYSSPSWYRGGLPDMYGAAATLYTLLTGNPPDKMGRAAFLWPPQGEESLSESEQAEWKRLHAVIRRATEEQVAERYVDFSTMSAAVLGATQNISPKRRKWAWAAAITIVSVATLVGLILVGNAPDVVRKQQEEQKPSELLEKSKLPELTPDQKADYQALAGMVMGYMGEGNYANALASVEELLATYPQSRTQPAYSVARAMALKGLGRIDEAKDELRSKVSLSTNIAAMKSRKDLWEEMGDLEAAEKDMTQVIDTFGPATFPLFLRADVRAQRGNFTGVQEDRETAYKVKISGAEQSEVRKLVDTMWTPLETKYPGYGVFLKRHTPETTDHPVDSGDMEHDEAWVLEVFDVIMADIVETEKPSSESAMQARRHVSAASRDAFRTLDFAKALRILDQTIYSIPPLGNTPVLSLYRSLLLKRLDRQSESDAELAKLCHRDATSRLADARICLLNALGRRQEVEELVGRILENVSEEDEASVKERILLLRLRSRIRAISGNLSGVREDYSEALALADRHSLEKKQVKAVWDTLASQYPAYAAYVDSLPGK